MPMTGKMRNGRRTVQAPSRRTHARSRTGGGGTQEAFGSQPPEVFVGRQPIFDRRQRVIGYELLFRDSRANRAEVVDQAAATASVVLNSLTEIGFKRIVGARGAWIKVPRSPSRQGLVELLPQRAVVEILGREMIDDELIDTVAALRRAGRHRRARQLPYTPRRRRLLRHVDFVKLDLIGLGREGVRDKIAQLQALRRQAGRREGREPAGLAFCRAAGCELFQGYFFCRPEVMQSRRIDANRRGGARPARHSGGPERRARRAAEQDRPRRRA